MKWMFGAACAVAASLVAPPADACRIARGNSAYHATMAGQVSAYPDIYLARAISVEPRATNVRPLRTFLYEFEVLETLRGQPLTRFQQSGAPPFPNEASPECVTAGFAPDNGACQTELKNLTWRHAAHASANAGRHNWDRFYTLRPNFRPGMGVAEVYDPEIIIIGCGSRQASFELGETFLILRNENGAPIDRFGLNYQLITRPDDAWLNAVRYFVANETAERLPARSIRESLRPFGMPTLIQFDDCANARAYSGAIVLGEPVAPVMPWLLLDNTLRISFFQRTDSIEEARSHCLAGGQFIAYPETFGTPVDGVMHAAIPLFPLRDGIVDFSHLATQWTLTEPMSVPLEDVLAWPARDTEDAAGTP